MLSSSTAYKNYTHLKMEDIGDFVVLKQLVTLVHKY